MTRFDRQINLRGFGQEAQNKLKQSSVLVIGAGGLGCPALLYLAATGIGKIGIADCDTVSISNLNRQILYGENDAGKRKAVVATETIQQKYSDIDVECFNTFLDNSNALEIISQYDVVVDCCDNFSSRYMINDACVLLNKPLVYGAIYQYEGQVSVFNVKDEKGFTHNYRDLFPVPPNAKQIPDCNETGVLGVLPGVIGTMQATEAMKLITGIGKTLCGKILYYNLLQQSFYELAIAKNPEASHAAPANEKDFRSHNYSVTCATVKTIDWNKANEMYSLNPQQTTFVDVREKDELPRVDTFMCVDLPLSALAHQAHCISQFEKLLVFCQGGVRSEKAVRQLQILFPEKQFYSIQGGILDSLSQLSNKLYATEV